MLVAVIENKKTINAIKIKCISWSHFFSAGNSVDEYL